MIENKTIDGRPATVAYITQDFEPATADNFDVMKVMFDDGGGVLFLTRPFDDGSAEAQGFGRHRARHAQPFDDGQAEMDGFAKSRERHRRPHSLTADTPPLPKEDVTEPSVTPVESTQSVEHQLAAWAKAVVILDASEVIIRDVIERELINLKIDISNENVNLVVDRIMETITEVRTEAIKTAFRLVRDRLGDRPIADVPLARWAEMFLAKDLQNIDMAIRAGIVEGLPGAEVARKVVGSMGLNGVDGVTEFTRLKVAHLGRAAIKASNLRKMGVENP